MTELAILLAALSDTHAGLGELYADLAVQLDPAIDPDVLVLARAIQGEEAEQFGNRREELGAWIAHTAYNRWEKTWRKTIDGVPCTFEERVEYDWHGTVNVSEPEPWALAIAERVSKERRNPDPGAVYPFRGSGALFAMTLDDLQDHGWTPRAHDSLVHVIAAPDDSRVQFWFMGDSPEKKEDEHADHY